MQEVMMNYHRVSGGFPYMGLFFVSLLFLFIAYKDRRELWVYPNLLILLILFNPVLKTILNRYFLTGGTFGVSWRIWWIIPIPFLIALMFTKGLDYVKGKEKIFVTILICLTIVVSGRFIFNSDNFSRTQNAFQLPSEVIEVSRIIDEDLALREPDMQNVVAVRDVAWRIRLYNPEIRMYYGRHPNRRARNSEMISEIINSSIPDFQELNSLLEESKVTHLVIFRNQVYAQPEYQKTPEKLGYELIGITGHYRVYRTDF